MLPAEKAHHTTFAILRFIFQIPGVPFLFRMLYGSKRQKKVHLMGLEFPNRIGLAAGFDKDAKMMDVFAALGFGFIEIGTLTPRPQAGNEQPRLFRLPKDESLINRMGFNNEGVDAAVERLKKRPKGIIIGGNIGKNKATPNENAHEDYAYCFEKLFPYVDYFVVNVSSPNTPGLRDLQEKEPLLELLLKLQKLNRSKEKSKPILLKIAPDLNPKQLDDVIEIVEKSEIQGLIATNTTIDRAGLVTSAKEIERIGNGGLSGQALTQRSTELINYVKAKAQPDMVIVGVGGIHNSETAKEKYMAGAQLIQVYTGLIYEGPSLPARLASALAN